MNYKKMKQLREEKGLTQDELGNLVFTSRNMITMVENGYKEPSLSLLGRIAEALGVAAAELL